MLKKIYYAGFFVWMFLYILIYLRPELHFHVQQPAFLNTKYFFTQHLIHPGGLGTYISNCIMQGFYFNWLGSLIILFLATCLSWLLYLILNKLNLITNPVFIVIPFALSIVLFNDYYFPFELLVKSVFIFLSVFLLSQIAQNQRANIVYFLLSYLLVYYLFGSGSALVYSIAGLFVLYQRLPVKAFFKTGGGIIVLSVLLPYIMFTYIFNLSYKQAYFLFLPELPITLRFNESFLVYLFVFLLPAILFIDFFTTKVFNSNITVLRKLADFGKNWNVIIQQLVGFALITGIMITFTILPRNDHKRNIIQSDFYSYRGNWDKVIDIALSDKEYDIGINLNYNRALDNEGKFLQNFFDYPQLIGISSIFPDNLKSPIFATQTCDYYFDINYVSKSQHWAYAILTLEPYNARALKRLVITNLILGNYRASQTYLNVLSHNSLYSEFANHYQPYIMDTTLIANDPVLTKKRRLMPANFAVPAHISDRFLDLIARDSTNRQAYEHLQMCYMLEHDLGKFMNYFNESVKFYNQVPDVYEQALILYLYSTGQTKSKVKISEHTQTQFEYFLKIMKQCKNDKELAKSYLGNLQSTYIYYVSYLSPKVTNLTVESEKY